MVYGILIFNLETSKLYYNNFYYEEGNDIDKNLRTQYAIRLIMEDYVFKRQTSKDQKKVFQNEKTLSILDKNFASKLLAKDKTGTSSVGSTEFCEGCLKSENENFFTEPKTLLYRQIQGYCFGLILNELENIMLASHFLSSLLYRIEDVKVIETNIVYIAEYLDYFLPHGDLMFISISFSEYLDSKLKKIMNVTKTK